MIAYTSLRRVIASIISGGNIRPILKTKVAADFYSGSYFRIQFSVYIARDAKQQIEFSLTKLHSLHQYYNLNT